MEDLLSTHEEEDKTPFDLMWAAGFLEGEGCFHLSKEGKVRIKANQCRKGPLATLQEVLGCGNIFKESRTKTGNPIWVWDVRRAEQVYKVGRKLLPFMHEAKSAELEEVVEAAKQKRWYRPTLSSDKVRSIFILARKDKGLTYKEIAERFNVGRTTVGRIIRGESYSEITKHL